jgi:hypothetical protein
MSASVSFSKFKPNNFIPSSSDRFYIEIMGLGSKISNLKNDLIFLGTDQKRLLVKNVDVDEGNITMSKISFFEFFEIEYPKAWKKPESMSITFIDNHNGSIFKFFHKLAKTAGLTSFRGIKPTNLQDYSIAVKLIRYNKIGEVILDSDFTIFPKSLPKWINEYDNNAMQMFNIEFTIVDYMLNSI